MSMKAETFEQANHYAIRAIMEAMSLRISELCLSFSLHPNISDGNLTLTIIFSACKYSRKMKKGLVEFGANKGEGESEVTNQMFGRLQHPN